MISIIRTPSPLTTTLITDLTNEYLKSQKNVWNRTDIKKALLNMSYNKCAYCECNISEESKYMEVEHFLPKKHFPHKVVEWENLLPSCKRCNGKKGEHNPLVEPILNPAVDVPKKHLHFIGSIIRGKDDIGKNTVELLNLNDLDRLITVRNNLSTQVFFTLSVLLDYAINFETGFDTSLINKSRVKNGVLQLLNEAQPNKEFCATIATLLITSNEFKKIKKIMLQNNLWEKEHTQKFAIASNNALI